jgi:hypothetical protein
MPNELVNAPKQIRTASVTSVKATAQLYEQSIFHRLWEKRQNKLSKGTGSPTLVNYSRRSSTSSADPDPAVTILDSSWDPGCCPDRLPLATSTPVTMSSSGSSFQQITQAAGSLLGVGIPGVNPPCSLSLWRVVRGSKLMHLDLIHGLFIT